MKIAIFLDNDPTIRHFIHGGALSEIALRHDVVFAIPPAGHKRVSSDLDVIRSLGRTVEVGFPEPRRRLWRHWFAMEQMKLPLTWDKFEIWKVRWQTFGLKPSLFYGFLALPGIYELTKVGLRIALARHRPIEFEAFLDTEKPDLLLHPSTFEGHFINEVIDAGRARDIPSVLVMNSWDNPSVKRAAAGTPDWVVVWGEQTRRHTIDMMDVPGERVLVLGAAQFDVFRNPSRITREQFRKEHGIEDDAPVILYCGSSIGMNEAEHLELIDDAIEAGKLPPMWVVYRPHPWGVKAEAARRIVGTSWRHIKIEISMRGFLAALASQKEIGFHMAEYARTHDILSCADAVLSPLSTILIEAALHDRPALCYYPSNERQDAVSLTRNAALRHFKELLETNILLVAHNRDEIAPKLIELLTLIGDERHSSYVKDAVRFFVEVPPKPYPAALAELVESIGTGKLVHPNALSR